MIKFESVAEGVIENFSALFAIKGPSSFSAGVHAVKSNANPKNVTNILKLFFIFVCVLLFN
jgi:hypothetical protein